LIKFSSTGFDNISSFGPGLIKSRSAALGIMLILSREMPFRVTRASSNAGVVFMEIVLMNDKSAYRSYFAWVNRQMKSTV